VGPGGIVTQGPGGIVNPGTFYTRDPNVIARIGQQFPQLRAMRLRELGAGELELQAGSLRLRTSNAIGIDLSRRSDTNLYDVTLIGPFRVSGIPGQPDRLMATMIRFTQTPEGNLDIGRGSVAREILPNQQLGQGYILGGTLTEPTLRAVTLQDLRRELEDAFLERNGLDPNRVRAAEGQIRILGLEEEAEEQLRESGLGGTADYLGSTLGFRPLSIQRDQLFLDLARIAAGLPQGASVEVNLSGPADRRVLELTFKNQAGVSTTLHLRVNTETGAFLATDALINAEQYRGLAGALHGLLTDPNSPVSELLGMARLYGGDVGIARSVLGLTEADVRAAIEHSLRSLPQFAGIVGTREFGDLVNQSADLLLGNADLLTQGNLLSDRALFVNVLSLQFGEARAAIAQELSARLGTESVAGRPGTQPDRTREAGRPGTGTERRPGTDTAVVTPPQPLATEPRESEIFIRALTDFFAGRSTRASRMTPVNVADPTAGRPEAPTAGEAASRLQQFQQFIQARHD
jgi:hypothetical protein